MRILHLLAELSKLKRNTGMTKEQIGEYQQKKLRQLLRFAYDNSPYYRRVFGDAGIDGGNIGTLPLSAFPTLDKETLLNNFDELATARELTQEKLREYDAREEVRGALYCGRYHVVHSSGSTGLPGYFVYDDDAWHTMLLGIIRAALWDMSMPQIIALLIKRPRVLYVAATDGRYGGVMAVGDGIEGVGAKQLRLDINAPLDEWVSRVREFNPNLIIGYPSAIKILGELAEGISLNITRIITCGEPLDAGLRAYLEGTFRTKVFNFYGASESLALGIEDSISGGMTLFDDLNIIESIDGGIYVTSLYNFAQPLIRYRLNDTLVLREARAGEKYQFTKAEGLLGRSEDVIWFEDGHGTRDFLHPLAIEGFCIDGLRDYQFRKTSRNSFEMLAETSPSANAKQEEIFTQVKKRMQEILREKKLDYISFSVRHTERILPDPHSGKKRLII